ncbi:MAG: hypothetical protein R3F65_30460 [bacterium]
MSRYIVEREILDGYLVGISNRADEYLLDRLLPGVPGPAKGVILTDGDDIEQYGGDPDSSPERLPGDDISIGETRPPEGIPYTCQLWDRAYPVPVEDERRSQLPIPLLQRQQRKAVHYVKTWQERAFYSILNNTDWVYKPGAPAAGDRWTAATGDPIAQISTAVKALDISTGLTMILDDDAAEALARNAIVRQNLRVDSDRLHIGLDRYLEAYGRARGIERIEILSAKYNTSKDPDNRSLSRIASGGWCWIGVLDGSTAAVPVDRDLFINPTAIARIREAGTGWDTIMEYEWRKKSTMVGAGVSEAITAVDTNLGALLTGLAPAT